VCWYFTDEEVDEWEEEDEPPDEQLPDEVLQRYTGAHFMQRLAASMPIIQETQQPMPAVDSDVICEAQATGMRRR
jgi:hypothetical protein